MSKRNNQEDYGETDSSTREVSDVTKESVYGSFVKIALSAEGPRSFAIHMRAVLTLLEPQLTSRTRPMHAEMMTLVDQIKNEVPQDRVWHAPLRVRASKAAVRADQDRYLGKRARVLVLFEKVNVLHKMEPLLAAQDAFKQAQSARASKPRKLDEAERNRIAKRYWQSKADGTSYGIVKELAREFNVSATKINETAKKYKPLN